MKSDCPACHSDKTVLLNSQKLQHLVDIWRNKFDINVQDEFPQGIDEIELHKCSECKLEFWLPREASGSSALYEQLQTFDWYYKENKWEFIKALEIIGPDDRVMEFGAGKGEFLRLCKEHGIDCRGTEINEKAILESEKFLGKGVIEQAIFSDFDKSYNKNFSVVCSFQVLEHLSDVSEYFTTAKRLLTNNGILITSIPNNDSFMFKNRFTLLNAPPHHVNQFTASNLANIAKNHDLILESVFEESLDEAHITDYLRGFEKNYPIITLKVIHKIISISLRFEWVRKQLKGHSLLVVMRNI